jgi:hypothetical protein
MSDLQARLLLGALVVLAIGLPIFIASCMVTEIRKGSQSRPGQKGFWWANGILISVIVGLRLLCLWKPSVGLAVIAAVLGGAIGGLGFWAVYYPGLIIWNIVPRPPALRLFHRLIITTILALMPLVLFIYAGAIISIGFEFDEAEEANFLMGSPKFYPRYRDKMIETKMANQLEGFEFPQELTNVNDRPSCLDGDPLPKVLIIDWLKRGEPNNVYEGYKRWVSELYYDLPRPRRASSLREADIVLCIGEGSIQAGNIWKVTKYGDKEIDRQPVYVTTRSVLILDTSTKQCYKKVFDPERFFMIPGTEIGSSPDPIGKAVKWLDIGMTRTNRFGVFAPEQRLCAALRYVANMISNRKTSKIAE